MPLVAAFPKNTYANYHELWSKVYANTALQDVSLTRIIPSFILDISDKSRLMSNQVFNYVYLMTQDVHMALEKQIGTYRDKINELRNEIECLRKKIICAEKNNLVQIDKILKNHENELTQYKDKISALQSKLQQYELDEWEELSTQIFSEARSFSSDS